MSIKTGTLNHTIHPPVYIPTRQFVIKWVRGFFRAIAGFMTSLQAAQCVVRRAEHLRLRSNQELARVGLTRHDIPAELLREFERCRIMAP